MNYATTQKELLAIIFAFNKFQTYLLGYKTIVYTDPVAIKFLFEKNESKSHMIRWVLFLQKFHLEIMDMKGLENMMDDHLSHLPKVVI